MIVSLQTNRAGSVQYLQHALLPIHLHLLPVAVLYGGVVLLHEDALDKLDSEGWLANTSASQHHNLVFSHVVLCISETDQNCHNYDSESHRNSELSKYRKYSASLHWSWLWRISSHENIWLNWRLRIIIKIFWPALSKYDRHWWLVCQWTTDWCCVLVLVSLQTRKVGNMMMMGSADDTQQYHASSYHHPLSLTWCWINSFIHSLWLITLNWGG